MANSTTTLPTQEPTIDQDNRVQVEIAREITSLTELPTESVLEVLSYLSPSQLAIVSRLSAAFTVYASDDHLWKPLCLHWGIENGSEKKWKERFKNTIEEQKRAEKQAAKECWKPTTYVRKTWHKFTQGGYAVVGNRPCKVVDLLVSRPGKHGSSKAHINAVDLFTGTQYQQVFPFGAEVDIPEVERREFTVLNVDEKNGTVSLLSADSSADEKELPLPQGDLGDQVRDSWEQGQTDFTVTVLSVKWDLGNSHEEAIIAVKK